MSQEQLIQELISTLGTDVVLRGAAVPERYHPACLKASLDQPATLALRNLLQTPEWLAQMATLPGYSPWACGEV